MFSRRSTATQDQRGLFWNCRQQVRRGALASNAAPIFMPLRITADQRQSLSPLPTTRSSSRTAETARIEIALTDGTCILVGDDACLKALRRVMLPTSVRVSALHQGRLTEE